MFLRNHPTLKFLRNYHRPTIYALSTKPGRAAISVIRILGTQAQYVYNQLTNTKKSPISQRASVRKLYGSQGMLDEALTLFFKGPNTFTGEDILELHVHGGNAIVKGVLAAIKKLHDEGSQINIRYADHGEFSQRAFLNGRFDLTEVEGIREMIDAETESQRRSALASMTGGNKRILEKWRGDIVNNVALLTTVIDFGEEHDVEETEQLFSDVEKNIDGLISEITGYLQKVKGSEILLKGIKVSLLGPPNAGKLSLLNYLANNDSAIVSEIAGTTRDVLDIPLDIEGYKVVVGDTAGIRPLEDADTIEKEGIKRAKQRALVGDLVLAVLPVDEPISPEIRSHLALIEQAGRPFAVILNKSDLLDENSDNTVMRFSSELSIPPLSIFLVSCVTEDGMNKLKSGLISQFKTISLSDSSDPVTLSARAQDLLENDVLYGLHQFKIWKDAEDVVLASECLRQSVDGIGRITGQAIGVEEILGVVFSSFCIGK
ncbi:CIC11C00000000034 [Sungouiella intermedia]|uniref:CIC11C00000000034 n=1 Tax=Sungouiella intermedia TaxID=45354 RepID=A0A1L0DBG1_9ASCO|nr:CIC11C00000000034 [[Candida] intermedia]